MQIKKGKAKSLKQQKKVPKKPRHFLIHLLRQWLNRSPFT